MNFFSTNLKLKKTTQLLTKKFLVQKKTNNCFLTILSIKCTYNAPDGLNDASKYILSLLYILD